MEIFNDVNFVQTLLIQIIPAFFCYIIAKKKHEKNEFLWALSGIILSWFSVIWILIKDSDNKSDETNIPPIPEEYIEYIKKGGKKRIYLSLNKKNKKNLKDNLTTRINKKI